MGFVLSKLNICSYEICQSTADIPLTVESLSPSTIKTTTVSSTISKPISISKAPFYTRQHLSISIETPLTPRYQHQKEDFTTKSEMSFNTNSSSGMSNGSSDSDRTARCKIKRLALSKYHRIEKERISSSSSSGNSNDTAENIKSIKNVLLSQYRRLRVEIMRKESRGKYLPLESGLERCSETCPPTLEIPANTSFETNLPEPSS
ncbi:hypothetical protein Ahia01_000635400 [Argonauta hians]